MSFLMCLLLQLGGLCFNDTRTAAVQGSVPPASIWFRLYLDSSFLACSIYNNATACQLLTNMVLLDPAGENSKAFNLYNRASSQSPPLQFLPQLFYSESLSLEQTAPTGLTFLSNSQINLKVVKFDARGSFLGWEDVLGGTLQLCPDTQQRLDASYLFGTTYLQSCSIAVMELLSRYPEPVFYQLFLKYRDRQGVDMVWPIPVQHLNQVSSPDGSMAVRRFFLVDGLTGRDRSVTQQPLSVRYLSRLLLRVNVPTSSPAATPPFQLLVEYNTVNDPANAVAQVSFAVTYSMSEEDTRRGTAISLGVLGVLSLLLAMLETSSWSQRAGQQYISLTVIVKFLAFLIGNLANAFFLVSFGTSVYWLIAFKGQRSTVNMVLPSSGGTVETDLIIFLSLAFVFKALQVIHMLIVQVSISIFLIDWEKPRNAANASAGLGVSAWRIFFVANEWNEIQTARKLNPLLQLLTVLLILQVIGVENIASRDLNLVLQPEDARYSAPTSPILRFGLSASVWLAVGLAQVLFYLVIYERFVEDKFRQFVDLCSLSNVSVFILAHRCYGYYIHGRSVHGHADVSIEAVRANLRREEANLCALRGLEPNSDIQTFEIALTDRVRQQLDRIMLSLTEASGAQGQSTGAEGPQEPQEQTTKAYHAMKYFLSSFLEHAHKDMDYIVKDKLLLERIMKYEFQRPVERTIFYRDPDGVSFTNVLYFSNELTLLLFDTLLFCIIDLGSQNLVLATVLTYAVQQVLDCLRYYISRRNVSEKTLVDQRFLI
ncbi:meckelin-like [Anguilla rostrata]|uniref:meckelin-like n=1 Tax=Anguilla rostrata TaxID=7938 RepID=UPI0030D36DBA